MLKRNALSQSDARSIVVMREQSDSREILDGRNWQVAPMPYFNFDLVIGEDFKNQGGMILEDSEIAIDKANSLASELRIVRPDLRSRECAVRYRRRQSRILPYSSRPIPLWLKRTGGERRGLHPK